MDESGADGGKPFPGLYALYKEMPSEFLRMIVVHELAHIKERGHDKAFYQLCRHMAPDYHQLEFDLRAYLSHLEAVGQPLWAAAPVDIVMAKRVWS